MFNRNKIKKLESELYITHDKVYSQQKEIIENERVMKAKNLELFALKEGLNVKAEDVIKQYFEKGKVNWYDYNDLKPEDKNNYMSNAERVLRNPTFQNEISHYIAEITKEIATNSKNFDNVLFLRASISSLIALQDRLGDIKKPDKPVEEASEEDLHEPI